MKNERESTSDDEEWSTELITLKNFFYMNQGSGIFNDFWKCYDERMSLLDVFIISMFVI